MPIIGLTGENGSGKGTVAEYLKQKGFIYTSLSDIVREETKSQGMEITRDNLIKTGNALREKFGPGILAVRLMGRIDKDKNYVVDSIRNPKEVEELRKLKGFVLIYVTAPLDVRFEREKARGRENAPQTLDEFMRIEKLEAKNPSAAHLQGLATYRMADRKLVNDSDLETLYRKIDALLYELMTSGNKMRL